MVVLNAKSCKYEVDYELFEKTLHCNEFLPLILTENADEVEEDIHANHYHEHHHLHTNRNHSSRIAY